MKGLIWNVRGLNQPGRKLYLEQLVRENMVDFVGIHETKKGEFSPSFLKNLSNQVAFSWFFLPTNGIAGGILVGAREDKFMVSGVSILKFLIRCILQGKE
jgi:hypothetical protein